MQLNTIPIDFTSLHRRCTRKTLDRLGLQDLLATDIPAFLTRNAEHGQEQESPPIAAIPTSLVYQLKMPYDKY